MGRLSLLRAFNFKLNIFKLSILKYLITGGSSDLWQHLPVKTLIYKHFNHGVLHRCWTLCFASWATLMHPDSFSKTINFDLEKEQEWKESLKIYFKPLNETNVTHSKETLFRVVQDFGIIHCKVLRQRVNQLISQKAVSLIYLQPFLIHREIYPGFLKPLILHRISFRIFVSIELFPKRRNSFTLVLKSVIENNWSSSD